MLNTRFPPWPAFDEDDIAAVAAVLKSGKVNYWTGTECREFEAEFAASVETQHAIAVANGTVALDLALHGLAIGPGDEVIVTPRSFIASASAVVNAGAVPIFADVDRESGNLTAATIAAQITPATRAVIIVHLSGWPADMDAIMDLAHGHGIAVIEDCAQAHGARYKDRPIGGIGHVGAWSFCQDKIMTTGGEGGMVTTNDPALWDRMWAFKDHGKSWTCVHRKDHQPGYRWLHESFGTNWRMTEMQAAIGRVQLRKLPEWTRIRQRNAAILARACRAFEGGALRTPLPPPGAHGFYRFYTFVRPEGLAPGWSRDRILAELGELGIPCGSGICAEIYKESAFENNGLRPDRDREIAAELGANSIMLLTHPTLTVADMAEMAQALTDIITRASQQTPVRHPAPVT